MANPPGPLSSFAPMDHEVPVDMKRLRAHRLARLQQSLRNAECAAAVLYDPINIRYASDARNMQIWTMHVPSRYLFVPAEGLPVLFDYRGAEHLSEGLETIGEVRRAIAVNHISGGPCVADRAREWATEIADLLRSAGRGPLAIDRTSVPELIALEDVGVELRYAHDIVEQARMIKSADEVLCMRAAITVAEEALAEITSALRPDITENELWAILNRVNAERGGEWIETRLLNSGPRTRPWFQEAGSRRVRPGELVCLDTDMTGPFGYNADISRSFFCGPGRPRSEQRTLYGLAREQLEHNAQVLRPGLRFREFRERAWEPPEGYRAHSFGYLHGIGLSVEYPQVAPAYELRTPAYDGVFQAGMIICVESYVTADNGREGVKLEDPFLIQHTKCERLASYPFEEVLGA